MNRFELVAAVQSYTHRTDQAESLLSTWFALAEARIWDRVRAAATESTAVVTVAGAAVALPAGYRQARLVTSVAVGPGAPLVYATPEQLAGYSTAGSVAVYYGVIGGLFDVRARVDGDYQLSYWGALEALVTPEQSNAVSVLHPDVYLNALLEQAFIWERDAEAATSFAAAFGRAVDEVNGRGNADRWS